MLYLLTIYIFLAIGTIILLYAFKGNFRNVIKISKKMMKIVRREVQECTISNILEKIKQSHNGHNNSISVKEPPIRESVRTQRSGRITEHLDDKPSVTIYNNIKSQPIKKIVESKTDELSNYKKSHSTTSVYHFQQLTEEFLRYESKVKQLLILNHYVEARENALRALTTIEKINILHLELTEHIKQRDNLIKKWNQLRSSLMGLQNGDYSDE